MTFTEMLQTVVDNTGPADDQTIRWSLRAGYHWAPVVVAPRHRATTGRLLWFRVAAPRHAA